MKTELPLYCGNEAIPELLQYCGSRGIDRFFLIADRNTYAALGKRVEQALEGQAWDVETILLDGEEVIADEEYLIQVLFRTGAEERMYVAAGSGTITDITRFCSHRSRNEFVSLPTAPSVDGFASIGAPLVVRNIKVTAISQPPAAIFADLSTLCEAPRDMIAAGFGDILGKYTSLADWKLGHIMWDEPYSEAIEQRVRSALKAATDNVESIAAADPVGITKLLEALVESGLCMVDFGQTRPASGSEHHISHYWEMRLLQETRPAVLHGAKVGIGTLIAAEKYERLRAFDPADIAALKKPEPEEEIAEIEAAYGALAEGFIVMQEPFLAMTEPEFEALKQRAIDRWPEIQAVASTVPPPDTIKALLETVDGPIDAKALGFSDEEINMARNHSHYTRARFTMNKFGHLLGMW